MKQLQFLLLGMVVFLTTITSTTAQCPNSYTINTNNEPICATATNGSLGLSWTTYYSNSTFLWSNGSTTRNAVGLTTGMYYVTVTDPTNCTYIDSTYLAVSPGGMSATASYNQCQDKLTGQTNSYNYPLTYQWSSGSIGNNVLNPASGNHFFTVTDADGCSAVSNVVNATGIATITVTDVATPASCNASDGSIDITAFGGTAPYTYQWWGPGVGGAISEDLSNIPRGSYSVTVRDQNNCSVNHNVIVGGPSLDISTINPSCGLSNGSLAVSTNLSNYQVLWSNGATTSTISGLSSGAYTVTVTDGSCTLIRDSLGIYNTGNINVYVYDTLECNSNTVSASVWGGSGNYTYLWNTGETTYQIIPTVTGTYTVTVTDQGGCSAVGSTTVNTIVGNLNISYIVQDATCGNSDGAIDFSVTGGTNFTYQWSPTGATTEDISGIAAGFHTVEVSWGWGCTHTEKIPVGEFVEMFSTDASCGLANGTGTVQDYGMSSPTYLWSNGASTAVVNNFSAGTHYVTVTNGSCVLVDSVVIQDAGQAAMWIRPSSGCAPESLAAIPTGGAHPMSYSWSTGAQIQSINNLTAGATYTVTMTDANGCTVVDTYTEPNYPTMNVNYNVTDAVCGNSSGIIDLTVTGGTAPFSYDWSIGGATAEDLNGVRPGIYHVTITDNNGCEEIISNIAVGGHLSFVVNTNVTQPNSSGTGGTASVTTNANNVSYLWSNGATTSSINNLGYGTYCVTVTDLTTGCSLVKCCVLAPQVIRIRGRVRDVSSNLICQNGLLLPNEMVRLQPTGQIAFTDHNGIYEFIVGTTGTYTVEYVNTLGVTSMVCPTSGTHTVNATVLGAIYGWYDFFVANPEHQDLMINVWDYSRATPGFPYYTRLKYCNRGNFDMNGTVEYDYNPLLGFHSIQSGTQSNLTLHDIANHKFYWSFNNLVPGDCRDLDVKFTVPTTTALGTLLEQEGTILPINGDAVPANNVSREDEIVVGAWDPNDKQVFPYHTGNSWDGGVIYETEEELEYLIRFQNTGTAPANFVIIRDTLDANLIPETIREIDTKHNVVVSIEDGNVLVFTFNNIYLPDSSVDFDASIGFARFKINRVAGLPIGTEIKNTAAIYFDYNAPVITNTPVSTIGMPLSAKKVSNVLAANVMPNPFNHQLTLGYYLNEAADVSIKVTNTIGQVVYTYELGEYKAAGNHVEVLDLGGLAKGMYLLNIETNKEVVTKKIIKQE